MSKKKKKNKKYHNQEHFQNKKVEKQETFKEKEENVEKDSPKEVEETKEQSLETTSSLVQEETITGKDTMESIEKEELEDTMEVPVISNDLLKEYNVEEPKVIAPNPEIGPLPKIIAPSPEIGSILVEETEVQEEMPVPLPLDDLEEHAEEVVTESVPVEIEQVPVEVTPAEGNIFTAPMIKEHTEENVTEPVIVEAEQTPVEDAPAEEIVFADPTVEENTEEAVTEPVPAETEQTPMTETPVEGNIFTAPMIEEHTEESVAEPISTEIEQAPIEETPIEEKPKEVINAATLIEIPKAEEAHQDSVDYFHYDFDAENHTKEKEEEKQIQKMAEEETKKRAKEGEIMDFDFYNIIRPTEEAKPVVPQEDRIELTKVLEPKEESDEEKETLFTISEEEGEKHRHQKNVRQYYLYGFYIFLALFVLFFLWKIIDNMRDFTLAKDEITLAIQSSYRAEIIHNKKIEDNFNFEWETSNNAVATVDDYGIITAINKGSAVITVKSKKTNKKKTISINAIDIAIKTLDFAEKKITLKEGEEKNIFPIINNDSSIIANLDWLSLNENIVEVDQSGHIKAISPGTTTILVEVPNQKLSAEITIEVVEAKKKQESSSNEKEDFSSNSATQKVDVKSISLSKTSLQMNPGDTVIVDATISPKNATNKAINWSSSNTSIATVVNGKITAHKAGRCTITATTVDGKKKASITITVEEKETTVEATGITLNHVSLSLTVGDTSTLKATVTPSNATNKNVIWSVDNKEVLSVEDGKLTALQSGIAVVTAMTEDKKFKVTCTVTIKEKEEEKKPEPEEKEPTPTPTTPEEPKPEETENE